MIFFHNPAKRGPQLPSGCDISVPMDFPWETHFTDLAGRTRTRMIREFFDGPVVPGDTPLAKVPFLALDLETTGLDPEKDRIISIGFVPFDMRRIMLSGGRNFLINPGECMMEETVSIHRIRHSDLDAQPCFDEVLPVLLKAMENRIAVVHYHPIERRFLAGAVKRFFSDILEFPMIDTMVLEHRLHTPEKKFWRFRRDKKPRVSLRLDASRGRYGLPQYVPHHALTDAIATAELLQAQIQAFYSPDTALRSLWI